MYRPHPLSIWFWKSGTLRVEINRIGVIRHEVEREAYKWVILDIPYGVAIHEGVTDTLQDSKQAVWNVLDKIKLGRG